MYSKYLLKNRVRYTLWWRPLKTILFFCTPCILHPHRNHNEQHHHKLWLQDGNHYLWENCPFFLTQSWRLTDWNTFCRCYAIKLIRFIARTFSFWTKSFFTWPCVTTFNRISLTKNRMSVVILICICVNALGLIPKGIIWTNFDGIGKARNLRIVGIVYTFWKSNYSLWI